MESEIKLKTNFKAKPEKTNKKVQIIENKKSVWDDFQKEEKSLSTSYLLNNHYSTPQPIKLPKPSQKAFFSDGYESKKKKTRQTYQHTPKTPSKQYTLNSFSDVNLLTPTPNRSFKFEEISCGSDSSGGGGSFSSPTSPTKSRSKLERLFSPHSDSSLSSPLPLYQPQFTINQNFDDPQSPIQTHKISYKNTSRILDKDYVEEICQTHIEKEIPKNILKSDYLGSNFVDKRVIGHGSFAIVYKVKDLKDNKYYAVKVAKNPFHGEKDRINQLEEVNIWWKIGNNDHCVQLHQAWEQDGILHLQLDLCDGGSLQDYLETTGSQSTLPESHIWKILLDICKGLEHVHNLNIVHLDIKPANIFIKKLTSGELILKIGDFGLARKCPVPPNTGLEGDKVYLAPEVLGDDGFETSADIFSLGLILVEMASNTYLPDTGVYWQDLRKGNITLCENLDHSSPELLNLIKRMIDPNPKLRPTATEIMKIAEDQLEKYSESDLTEPVPNDLTYEIPELPSSSSSSMTYTLSSSSSFMENDVEIIDDTPLSVPNKKKLVNERKEEEAETESGDPDLNTDPDPYLLTNNKIKRKKRLSLGEFIITQEKKMSSSTQTNGKATLKKKTTKETSGKKRKGPKKGPRQGSSTASFNSLLSSSSSSPPPLLSSPSRPKRSSTNNPGTSTTIQQTLISDHFLRKKEEDNLPLVGSPTPFFSSPTSPFTSSPTSPTSPFKSSGTLSQSLPTTSSFLYFHSSPTKNPLPHSLSLNALGNSPSTGSVGGGEHQEVCQYYKQEKLSGGERRRQRKSTLLDLSSKTQRKKDPPAKMVMLDLGKRIHKVKGHHPTLKTTTATTTTGSINKKRVQWKEWNKRMAMQMKDDSLNQEILFCNED